MIIRNKMSKIFKITDIPRDGLKEAALNVVTFNNLKEISSMNYVNFCKSQPQKKHMRNN